MTLPMFASPPAPFPADRLPMAAAEEADWIQLARSENIGPVTFRRLMNRYRSARAAIAALPDLAAKGRGRRGYTVCDRERAEAEQAAAAAAGAHMIPLASPKYSPLLAATYDAPPMLWVMGQVEVVLRPSVAIVGARNASALGLRMARMLASDLGAEGWVVVSGLARGVDTAAHEASVETGTVAVQAGGVDHIYPAENVDLAHRITEAGCRVSEMPMGTEPMSRHFPARNRIIAGLSAGVVVVEAAERSGTLITARYAIDQGREAMAVPGAPLDARSGGCNQLIRQGAALIRNADDVLDALSHPRRIDLAEDPAIYVTEGPAPEDPPEAAGEDLQDAVLSLLGPSPVETDELIRLTGVSASIMMQTLLELDLAGRVTQLPGGQVTLSPSS